MQRPEGAGPSRPSPWAEPPAFLVDLLVEQLVRSELRGHTVASLRLVSSRWRTAASAAVRALAARCNNYPSLACNVGSMFPHLKVLQLHEGGLLDAAADLGGTLQSLHLLGSHNTREDHPVPTYPPTALAALAQLTGLVDFELEASWDTCCRAAGHLAGLERLRSLTLSPMAVSYGEEWTFRNKSVVLLEHCSQLSGLHRLACAAHNAQQQHVAALTALQHLSALQLTGLPNELLPALAQLGSRLRSLSLVNEADIRYCGDGMVNWDAGSEGCTCTALPASTFSQLQRLEVAWDVLLAILLLQPNAAAIPAGTLATLTSLTLDMSIVGLDDVEEDDELPAMERRMELLPRWLFSTPTRLQHLRLFGASTFGGWPSQLLEPVSRLRALEAVSFENMHVDGAVVSSLARLPRLRELEVGAEEGAGSPWEAPLRACTGLTRLALVVRDSPMRVATEMAQLKHLRRLKLDGNGNIMTRIALEHILDKLPALELLQTEWDPSRSRDGMYWCYPTRRLLHSQFWDRCGPHWLHRYDPANFSAAAALADVAALLEELLVETVGEQGQVSVAWNLPASQSQSPDMPLNEPPLVRTVTGFQPEGIHLTQWTSDQMLVSWQTGEPLMGSTADAPKPYDPKTVKSVVRWGTRSGNYTQQTEGDDSLVYTYVYPQNLTLNQRPAGEVYHSPILHHVLLDLKGLEPGTTVFYNVGDEAHGWSEELSFTTLRRGFPMRLGMVGDMGQTANSSATLNKLKASDPDVVVIVGDFSYADDHQPGQLSGNESMTGGNYVSEQLRWDSWARMTQPVLGTKPLISCRGNHEIEVLLSMDNTTMMAAAARYPYPQDPAKIDTAANVGIFYLEQFGTNTVNSSGRGQFINESDFAPASGFYSLDLPGVAHIVSLNSYLPWGKASAQYKWLLQDLAKVDREQTPWLILVWHTAAYHSYKGHFKEADTFMSVYEDVLYEHGVDLVYAGHVHAYERTAGGVYKYQKDVCGPQYTLIGDGGNVEGLYKTFIDTQPQADFCAEPSLYQLPSYQPIPYEKPVITLQDGQFCPSSQPAYSAYREPTFGHGVLELVNATHARWAWQRTIDVGDGQGAVDEVWLAKPPAGSCKTGRSAAATDGASAAGPAPGASAPAAAPASWPGSGASDSGHGMLLLLLLGALAVAAALLQ
ncbi:purple acid phosphatase 23 isoform X1 [Chlorella sorokiniana]|uniref:Purple acid phosphatase n=1 Tax=Chlorella sorokiniana TaxID=3076 RepID=A0A2P6TJU2_CHLSO|nr:purple acid phosphatase 23 isoform X1 [Chlorella sorokiniana]|eukprot:PRW44351.1 purple acid phosphatase 23 isoform X1 [Chlorella sorokiniana]